MAVFTPPPGNPRIKVVASFGELVATRFGAGVNALCWPRALPGNYSEIVEKIGTGEGIVALDADTLKALALSAAGCIAREVLLEDQRLLRAHGLAPELNCIHGYPRDEEPAAVRTDVFSFHADRAPIEADTYLCTYHGPA